MFHRPFRAWINQPSALQPLHNLHGTLVLVVGEGLSNNSWEVCPIKGETISMVVPKLCVSVGWPEHLR